MQLDQNLQDAVSEKADQVKVDMVCLGLGYTAVTTINGHIGIAYTYFEHKTGCSLIQDYQNYEGRPASNLLERITTDNPLERSMALALINALNQERIAHLPPDKDNRILFDILKIGQGTKVAMVGFFKPLVNILEAKGAIVEIIDEFRSLGNKEVFFQKLNNWADAALVTSTSILNRTFEEIMANMDSKVRVAMLGPSTPIIPSAFSSYPQVKALAGIAPMEPGPILKAVRHGLGTPHLHRHSKKVTLII